MAESRFRSNKKRGCVDDNTIFNINININNNVAIVVVLAVAAAVETEMELIIIIVIVISSNNLVIINNNIIEAHIIEIDDTGDLIYMYQNNEKNNVIILM